MDAKVSFINKKLPDFDRVKELLDLAAKENMFANRGPLYRILADKFADHFRLDSTTTITPCANAGIALEGMARLLASQTGRNLKWIGSAFSFQNLGRGYFWDMDFVDCTEQGLLDLDAIKKIPKENYDGIILVNPLGIHDNFEKYIKFARETSKFLLLDNAAGTCRKIPDWPWQAFSLHHTKPYGMGEGGLALTPTNVADELYALLNYGEVPNNPQIWLNNGKISDISCAFLIQRLEKFSEWCPLYLKQADRIKKIMEGVGLSPLLPLAPDTPAMSLPYLAQNSIPPGNLAKAHKLTFGKYYKPLANFPAVSDIYSKIFNIPTHPDMALVSDDEIINDVLTIAQPHGCQGVGIE